MRSLPPSSPDAPGRRLARIAAALAAAGLAAACDGPQSALDPRGRQASEVAELFQWMVIGAAAIWAVVMLAAVVAVLRPALRSGARHADRLIFLGGVAFPTVVLAALLVAGLRLLPDWAESPARLKVEVTGEQFWWRVAYRREDLADPVLSANEIHLPAGEPVEFVLGARDVIHSFWIPSLAGKVDMIPGRETRLLVEDPEPGVYRGVCAEFCGTGHAQMALQVVVHPPEAFERWLADRARPPGAPPAAPETGAPGPGSPVPGLFDRRATAPTQAADDAPPDDAPPDDAQPDGRALFLDGGCGACHRVAGVIEAGEVGPDLTHFASRRSLAAGVAELSRAPLIDWLRDPQALKPGARMPAYGEALSEAELAALADWLLELR